MQDACGGALAPSAGCGLYPAPLPPHGSRPPELHSCLSLPRCDENILGTRCRSLNVACSGRTLNPRCGFWSPRVWGSPAAAIYSSLFLHKRVRAQSLHISCLHLCCWGGQEIHMEESTFYLFSLLAGLQAGCRASSGQANTLQPSDSPAPFVTNVLLNCSAWP